MGPWLRSLHKLKRWAIAACAGGLGGLAFQPAYAVPPPNQPTVFMHASYFARWYADLQKAAVQPKLGDFISTISRIDYDFNADDYRGIGDRKPHLISVDQQKAHLDRDPPSEIVVQVVFGFQRDGNLQEQLYWIGVFDRADSYYRLAGVLRRRVVHCAFDVNASLGIELKLVPGSMILRQSRVDRCDQRVNIDHQLEHYLVDRNWRLRRSRVVSLPDAVDWERGAAAARPADAPAAH